MAYNYEYPYTDPYRYNDDWLLRKMRDLIEEWAAMQKQFADLQTAFNDLKNYVMNYFANLNVQAEVNNKIDSMIADGSFAAIVNPLVNKYLYKGDNFNGRTILWMSDSWGIADASVSTPHPVLVANNLKSTLINLSIGGRGYVTGGNNTFIEQLKSWVENPSNNTEEISFLIVSGSINDSGREGVQAAVSDFISYARAHFSNAKIILVGCPGNLNLSLPSNLSWFAVYQAVKVAAFNAGVMFVDCFGMFIGKPGNFQSDNVHPNQSGQNLFASKIASFLLGAAQFSSFGSSNFSGTGSDNSSYQIFFVPGNNIFYMHVIVQLQSQHSTYVIPQLKGINMDIVEQHVSVNIPGQGGLIKLTKLSDSTLRFTVDFYSAITAGSTIYAEFAVPYV